MDPSSTRAWRLGIRDSLRKGFVLVGVGAAYFAIAKIGLSFSSDHDVVSAVWPPSGIALAAVVLLGARVWPAIAAGAFLANVTGDSSAAVAAGIAAGNALAALAAGAMLTAARFDPALRRLRDVGALAVLGAGASTALNACIGVGTMLAAGIADWESAWSFWRVWWLGDMTGVLLVAPAVMLPFNRLHPVATAARIVEASMLALLIVAISLLVLFEDVTLAFPVFPVIVLAAMRFRQEGAIAAALLVSALAVVFTDAGEGPFIGGSADAELLRAQVFVGIAALTGLLVASMRTEWERALAAAERLGDSERALGEAQALAHVGSWAWDIRADRLEWSDELYRIFGIERSGFGASYEAYLEACHPDDRRRVDAEVRAAAASRDSFVFEHRVVWPTGEVRTVEGRGRVIRDEAGDALTMVGTAQDVTERELARERFRALLESAPDAMVIVDESGEIVLVNSQTVSLFGYTREELIGRPVELLMPERARGAHPNHRGAYMADPSSRPMGIGLDLVARRKDGTEFPVEISLSPLKTEDGLLISSAIRDVTERKLAAERLQHQALHDPLTDLPNRTLFLDRLEHALARSRRPEAQLAVFFCDIDDFKNVNDSLGHEAGDRLLVALPPRLRQALRTADTVARFGGDEFVVLCEDLESEADALRIAERILEAFAHPFATEGRTYHPTASVGVVVVEGARSSASEILRDADAAMYRAKSGGKGRFELFDARMRARLVERLETESGLRRAIDEGELLLHYQPVFCLGTDEIVGAEALVRWQHPEQGLLFPGAFIDVAEDSGLIVPLGEWVVEEACRQLGAWKGAHSRLANTRLSINLSPRQVADATVVDLLASAVRRHRIDPSALELEITESVLLEDTAASVETLARLKEMGVRLVLDDFGTGYSSLGYLKRFPLDALKIDREFIDGLGREDEDTAIVTAVLSMAQALDLAVVAEGVETEGQLEWLRDNGCDLAQGYLLGSPVPAEDLERLRPWRVGAHAPRRRVKVATAARRVPERRPEARG